MTVYLYFCSDYYPDEQVTERIPLKLDTGSREPIYRQIISQVEDAVRTGALKPGDQLPSMNELAAGTGISRETAKKAYNILRDNRVIESHQGKGVFISSGDSGKGPSVLVLFDKLSIYKQILFNAFSDALGPKADITILNHDQNLDVFEYYLDKNLDRYDYYVITPHFPLDAASQKRACKLLRRVPNRKLIMTDHWLHEVPGNYGVVFQDFSQDAYDGLLQGLDKFRTCYRLSVITLPESLYGNFIKDSVRRFCSDYDIPVRFTVSIPADMEKGEVFLLLNSQLDSALVDLDTAARDADLETGRDIFVISYNEFPLNEIILGGLTTLSTDFALMGRLAAGMILTGKLEKVHCDFRLTRRASF